ncbi:MAG TPA: tetratricopeptide repeat protein [Tepidisphaeraceae bacterium]|jgi:predicted O-linked N-acetylglucosamine transferase (SPINDLY family)|nr:tetratricopeptide repeat protein [Tepidisphaeraceae bacterium]
MNGGGAPQWSADQVMRIAIQHHDAGRLPEARAMYRQVLARQPNQPAALYLLGIVALQTGQWDESIELIRRAIAIDPNQANYHSNLGNALLNSGRIDEAIAAFSEALRLKPDFVAGHNNLGNALRDKGRTDEAIAAYRQALQIQPDLAHAHSNLGNALMDAGEVAGALAAYRRALELNPDLAFVFSNLLYVINFIPDFDAAKILEESRGWAERFERPLVAEVLPHPNDRSPTRRIRVGYVSPDFRGHPVGRFLVQPISNHDPQNMEVFCYSDTRLCDDFTAKFKQSAHAWRECAGVSDAQLARQIRADRIDILVDLSLHTAGNRLLVFARKPAPVQVTWLGYPGTTGLSGIDYRLTDPYLDPPGEGDELYAEQSIRLPSTSLCYSAPERTSEANPPPALQAGYVTFGSFNNFTKLSDVTIALWAEVLRAVAGSRLLIKARQARRWDRVVGLIEKCGVAADRVEFIGGVGPDQYFGLYHCVDICLDPTPYSGHTTTCDALWMGVPTVTLRGRTAVGRGGVSILSSVGLTDWIAQNPQQYVSIARAMAEDLPRLAQLRSTLRRRMQNSPLMDAKRFALDLDAAFRRMWSNWCSGAGR